ncbi:PepSY-associated TM helix domain-containing protein [Zobellella iuensis]|uniref:PepSY domain-containing protein n=1 Tax=Zobellella iuensis TaxID=2803811 RepID=A0ABS1QMU0_9GAMM|nr:PepSY-associated TM helix domain-containing protein [Zobellella iuensis]MBL1376180.1 PepSY domain-containing protein [Zobellella iuensis]
MSTATRQTTKGALLAFLTRLHFYIGLLVGPFILVAALTGTLYVLSPQLEARLYAKQLTADATGTPHSLAEQITAAQAVAGEDDRLFAVRPAPHAGSTTRVMFSRPGLGESESHAVFVDPVTLAIQGELTVYGTSGILPFRITLDYLHRNLMLGDFGRHYSELAASWLWVAALGGMALWLLGGRPSKAAASRGGTMRLRRLHGLTGLWILLGLLFFSATGLTWSKWAGDRIGALRTTMGWVTPSVSLQLDTATLAAGAHTGHDHGHGPAPAAGATGLAEPALFDTVLATARAAGIDADIIEIRPARSADSAWMVREVDRSWPTQVDTLAIDPASLQVTSRADFAEFPLVAKLIRWGIDAHMGILFGLANQLLLAAFGLALSCMIVLGYLAWWRRRPAAGSLQPLLQAWQRLGPATRAASLALAAALGWCLPVLGASLLLFLLVDLLRWRRARQAAPLPAGTTD